MGKLSQDHHFVHALHERHVFVTKRIQTLEEMIEELDLLRKEKTQIVDLLALHGIQNGGMKAAVNTMPHEKEVLPNLNDKIIEILTAHPHGITVGELGRELEKQGVIATYGSYTRMLSRFKEKHVVTHDAHNQIWKLNGVAKTPEAASCSDTMQERINIIRSIMEDIDQPVTAGELHALISMTHAMTYREMYNTIRRFPDIFHAEEREGDRRKQWTLASKVFTQEGKGWGS